jgi:hypothetical protein
MLLKFKIPKPQYIHKTIKIMMLYLPKKSIFAFNNRI